MMGTIAEANAFTSLWHVNPVYLTAKDRQVAPGGRGTYVDTRTAEYTSDDRTTFIAGQASWCKENLPDIIKMIAPPATWDLWNNTHLPELKRTADGTVEMERWPEPGKAPRELRRFDVLPDQIFSGESGWVLEAWIRLDPTIKHEDILMRMSLPHRPRTIAVLIQRRLRWRDRLNLILWQRRAISGNVNERTERILASLPVYQVAANSTEAHPNSPHAAFVANPAAAPTRLPADTPIGLQSVRVILAPLEGPIIRYEHPSAQEILSRYNW